jgi:hypothetical protein
MSMSHDIVGASSDAQVRRYDDVAATANGDAGGPLDGQVIQAKPLAISGLIVTKADLLDALRVYVPGVQDITMLDGEHFQLWTQPIVPPRP